MDPMHVRYEEDGSPRERVDSFLDCVEAERRSSVRLRRFVLVVGLAIAVVGSLTAIHRGREIADSPSATAAAQTLSKR